MLKPMWSHKGKRYPTSALVENHEGEGRMLIVKRPGAQFTRVAPMAADGTVRDVSLLVPTADGHDIRPVVENQRRRPLAHHAGKVFAYTALVKGLEAEGRKFIVQQGAVETRVIDVKDGLSVGNSYVVPAQNVIDVKPAPVRQEVCVDERGALVIPASLRERFGIAGRWIVQVEERDEGFLVRPLRATK